MKDIDFIKQFANITITSICKELDINIINLYNRAEQPKQQENAKLIRAEIEKRFETIGKTSAL